MPVHYLEVFKKKNQKISVLKRGHSWKYWLTQRNWIGKKGENEIWIDRVLVSDF